MSALKPCPFCGSKAEIERLGTPRQSTIYSCDECGCRLETGEEWAHGTLWNARAAPDLTDHQLHLMAVTFIATYRGGNGMEAMKAAFDAAFSAPPKKAGSMKDLGSFTDDALTPWPNTDDDPPHSAFGKWCPACQAIPIYGYCLKNGCPNPQPEQAK